MYVILSLKETEKGEVAEAKYQSDELDLGHLRAYAPGTTAKNVTTGKTYILKEDKTWELAPEKVEKPKTAKAKTTK